MRKAFRVAVVSVLSVLGLAAFVQARSILEKTVYYISNGSIGSCKYWTLHLGTHDVKLQRKFPGEDMGPVDARVNLSLVSSGYVEGNGYGDKGKVQCRADLAVKVNGVAEPVPVDSIDYVFDSGRQIKLLNGKRGAMVISVEGFPVTAPHLQLWTFNMGKVYGEEVLKKSNDIMISAFSFSKEGIARAQKEAQ